MPTAYSLVSDLLIGDVQVGDFISPQKFVNDAAAEMDSRIGMLYTLPLPLASMPGFVQTLLQLINNRIASGRIIMAAAAASQSRELNAYGATLVADGYKDLKSILDGSIPLDGAGRRPDGNQSLGPAVSSRDATSGVDAFEDYFFPPSPLFPPFRPPLSQPVWHPGS